MALAAGPATPEAVRASLLAYVSPSYIQNRAGTEADFEGVVSHLVKVRSMIAELKIEVLDLVVDEKEGGVASRHVSWVKRADGKESGVEVALFGKVDEKGMFTYVYEMTRDLP